MTQSFLTIDEGVSILQEGGIIVFPTDTAFALSCRIDRSDSIKRLFRLRKRSETKAVPILVGTHDMAYSYYDHPSRRVMYLSQKYWPGAVTIIAQAQQRLFDPLLLGGGTRVGLRIPDHQIALLLIQRVGVPLIGTSANFSGGKTPYYIEDLDSTLISCIDGVIGGECHRHHASTVVDCTTEPPTLIRDGAVQIEWDSYE